MKMQPDAGFMSRRGLLLGLGGLALAGCAGGESAGSALFRQQLARQLAGLVVNRGQINPYVAPIQRMGLVGARLLALASGVNIEPVFNTVFEDFVDNRVAVVQDAAAKAFVKYFTLKDLNELIAVYESGAGQNVAALAYATAAGEPVPPIPAREMAFAESFLASELGAKSQNALGEVLQAAFKAEYRFDDDARRALIRAVEDALRQRGYGA